MPQEAQVEERAVEAILHPQPPCEFLLTLLNRKDCAQLEIAVSEKQMEYTTMASTDLSRRTHEAYDPLKAAVLGRYLLIC